MRFRRHDGIYRSDVVQNKNQTLGTGPTASRRSVRAPGKRTRREDHALLIVRDEFRPAIPRSGWSPPEPVSAYSNSGNKFRRPFEVLLRHALVRRVCRAFLRSKHLVRKMLERASRCYE